MKEYSFNVVETYSKSFIIHSDSEENARNELDLLLNNGSEITSPEYQDSRDIDLYNVEDLED